MHFAYEGFQQSGSKRCFLFRGIEEYSPISAFSIEIDLGLLLQNRLLIQDGPMFCVQLLTAAALGGSNALDKFRDYQVVSEDFRPLLIERERQTAEKARRKYHKPVAPLSKSNLRLVSALGKS
ncbi:MAG TPA: hypothetical protein VF283_09775 [Bryobacteraceae bacterium]